MKFIVTGMNYAQTVFGKNTVSHIVSILDDPRFLPNLGHLVSKKNWTQMFFEDIDDPLHAKCVSEAQIRKLIRLGKSLPEDARVGLHCHAGVSRSPAAALIMAVSRYGLDRGSTLFSKDVEDAAPNELMIKMADHILKLNGQLHYFSEEYANRFMDSKYGRFDEF